MSADNLIALCDVLDQASADRAFDIKRLAGMSEQELYYLDNLGEIPDPETDDMESEMCR